MSWQLASFAIVLASLAVAFWWYERSQPSAKLLAVIGHAGGARGARAGRVRRDPRRQADHDDRARRRGSRSERAPASRSARSPALASNILLGEGPWTPWQMLGWGLVAAFGAALGAIGGRRLSALAIALACALGAELFNLVLDIYTWTGTGNHTLAGFGVVLGAALVFDVTHVVASFAFGLAFGACCCGCSCESAPGCTSAGRPKARRRRRSPSPRAGASPARRAGPRTALLALGLLAFGLAHATAARARAP